MTVGKPFGLIGLKNRDPSDRTQLRIFFGGRFSKDRGMRSISNLNRLCMQAETSCLSWSIIQPAPPKGAFAPYENSGPLKFSYALQQKENRVL